MVSCYYLFIEFGFLLGFLHAGDCTDGKDNGLSVRPSQINANIGDKPSLICSVNATADFLIENPLQWVFVSRNTVEMVISTRATVELPLGDKFNVEYEGQPGKLMFTLKFLKGITREDDGYFKCAVHQANLKAELFSQTVEVKVLDATPVNNKSQYVTMTSKDSSANGFQSSFLTTILFAYTYFIV